MPESAPELPVYYVNVFMGQEVSVSYTDEEGVCHSFMLPRFEGDAEMMSDGYRKYLADVENGAEVVRA